MTAPTAKQQQAITLLASGKSQRQTAKAVGVSPQTITAWMKLEPFQKGLDGLLSTVEAESTQLLRSQRLKAVDALTDLLDSKAPAVRLAAARTVLEITASKAPPTEASAKFAAVLALLESTP